MIKQTKDYIQKKKKEHLIKAVIWGVVIVGIYVAGLVLTKNRANPVTVVAAVLVLPLALHITRFISFNKFKDPSPKRAACLEHMKGTYALYHSVIIPDTTTTLYFDHVVVTSRNFYFIAKDPAHLASAKAVLPLRLNKKGVGTDQMNYIHAKDMTSIKNTALKIQKDACFSDEQLGNNTNIIDGIIM